MASSNALASSNACGQQQCFHDRALAPNHTNTRLRNALTVLTLLLFTFVCAALYQGFAQRGGNASTFFFDNASWLEPLPHSFGAAQAA